MSDSSDRPVRTDDLFSRRLAHRRATLTPALGRIAAFIDANRVTVLTSSALDIARQVGTSDATVVRAVQALGFSGLQDLRRVLAAGLGEDNAPEGNLRRTLEDAAQDIGSVLDAALDTFAEGVEVLRSAAFRRDLMAALDVLRGRRIAVFGIGPTAHLAQYLLARLRRKGVARLSLSSTGSDLADELLDLKAEDGLLMLAFGTPYREALVVADQARRLGVPVVLVTDTTDSDLSRQARVTLDVPRGRSGRMALNGVLVLSLEMLLVGIATADHQAALASLSELEQLRRKVRSRRRVIRSEDEQEQP